MSTDTEIAEVVERYWDDNRRPVLLSALGGLLGQPAKEEIASSGTTLGQYIRRNLSDTVRLLRLSSHGGGAVPLDKTKELSVENLESLVPPPSQRLDLVKTKSPRFHTPLWNLFRNADAEFPAFVELKNSGETTIHTHSLDEKNVRTYEVARTDLPAAETTPVPMSEVIRAIRAWAARHDISLSAIRDADHI